MLKIRNITFIAALVLLCNGLIAQKAKQMGILTVGIVTRPFKNEGPEKSRKADKGIEDLKPQTYFEDARRILFNY